MVKKIFKNSNKKKQKKEKSFYDSWFFVISFFILLPLSFRILLFSPYHIPSGSMKPTLLEGDFLFVAKYSYGYSRYTFPFDINLFEGRKNFTPPKRGDIIVFRPPLIQKRDDYIKRLIGLPGDKIQVINGQVFINSKAINRKRLEDTKVEAEDGRIFKIERYQETLDTGVSYVTLDTIKNGKMDNTEEFIVPENSYFMMGDNRDNSRDSRDESVGYIPQDHLIGKAKLLVFSTDESVLKFWKWPSSFRKDRFFKNLNVN